MYIGCTTDALAVLKSNRLHDFGKWIRHMPMAKLLTATCHKRLVYFEKSGLALTCLKSGQQREKCTSEWDDVRSYTSPGWTQSVVE